MEEQPQQPTWSEEEQAEMDQMLALADTTGAPWGERGGKARDP